MSLNIGTLNLEAYPFTIEYDRLIIRAGNLKSYASEVVFSIEYV